MRSEVKEVRKRAELAREKAAVRQAVELFQKLGVTQGFELTADAKKKNQKTALVERNKLLQAAAEFVYRGEPVPTDMRLEVGLHLHTAGARRLPTRRGPNAYTDETALLPSQSR